MTRLQSELRRLYFLRGSESSLSEADGISLTGADGRSRAMVLALARPADWTAVSLVWQAVQSDLALPAPAIAVSGVDAYQLWFSLEEPVSVAEARTFLEALCARYLSHVASSRLEMLPVLEADVQPVREVRPEQWSAFVAPDLAPIFAETPWLDIPPSPEGQADLLCRLPCIKTDAWATALRQLRPAPASMTSTQLAVASPDGEEVHSDPRLFLRQVMNDETVALGLRIEAAKALLPFSSPPRP